MGCFLGSRQLLTRWRCVCVWGGGVPQTQFLLADVGKGMYAVLLPLVGTTFRSAIWGAVRPLAPHRTASPPAKGVFVCAGSGQGEGGERMGEVCGAGGGRARSEGVCGWAGCVWQEGGGLSLRLESGDPGETDMTVPTSLLIAAGRSNNTPPPPLATLAFALAPSRAALRWGGAGLCGGVWSAAVVVVSLVEGGGGLSGAR